MEMLRHIASLHAHPLDAEVLADRLGLGDCGRTPYRRLSGGQQQRLALARALLKDPPILILDEATAMFDPQGEAEFLEGAREALAGRTVLLITHRPASLAVASRIVRMEGGRIVGEDRAPR